VLCWRHAGHRLKLPRVRGGHPTQAYVSQRIGPTVTAWPEIDDPFRPSRFAGKHPVELGPALGGDLHFQATRRDYFSHLNPTKLIQKISAGDISISLVRMENSQKCAKGVHLLDLAKYLDARVDAARKEQWSSH
jgi:hypothetical protein